MLELRTDKSQTHLWAEWVRAFHAHVKWYSPVKGHKCEEKMHLVHEDVLEPEDWRVEEFEE